MLNISGRVPIVIHPFFWVLAFFIGWVNTFTFSGTVIWMVVILISVLVHEMGHALMGLSFGQKARIELVGFGGMTVREGPKLKLWQEFLVVFCGPFAGIALFLSALYLSEVIPERFHVFYMALRITALVNLFWSVFNLIPVLPLDGGHLMRIALEGAFGYRGVKISLFLGILLAMALAFFLPFPNYLQISI